MQKIISLSSVAALTAVVWAASVWGAWVLLAAAVAVAVASDVSR